MTQPLLLDAAAIGTAAGWTDAIAALTDTLSAGFDPEHDIARFAVDYPEGELLVMPSVNERFSGVKLVTLTPGNAKIDLPFIQGVYALFDNRTGAPLAYLDGVALTNLRTAAVTASIVQQALRRSSNRLLVFGSGVQAAGHIRAMQAITSVSEIVIVGRSPERAEALAREFDGAAPAVRVGTVADVESADIILCCTTATTPLFDGSLVGEDAIVAAIGGHSPSARETDDVIAARSAVVVDSIDSAMREAGDVVLALQSGAIDRAGIRTLADVFTGARPLPEHGPILFKGTGMPWQDLAVASRIFELHQRG